MTGPDALGDAVWRLRSLTRADRSVLEIAEPDRYTLQFLAGQVLVRADCNRCSGSYAVDGASLQLGRLACTKVACPTDSHEGDFLQVLDGTRSHAVRDGVLTIESANGSLRLAP